MGDTHTLGMETVFDTTHFGIKVYVTQRDLNDADAIAQEMEEAARKEPNKPECPKCGSNQVSSILRRTKGIKAWFSIVVSFLLLAEPLHMDSVYRCNQCGKLIEQ
jgi:DNA-directed RNA polymerase subunit M/transcription elongation factor TFIIS